MAIYISGIGAITTQPDNSFGGLEHPVYAQQRYQRCVDPSWSDFFPPLVYRRMSTIIRRSLATTKMALAEGSVEKPDAIISGTGLGCIEDTEKFLTSMINDNERFMKPTYFIHSTHNTISSQIAINLGCNGYNNTFAHRGSSFELALQDALLLFGREKIATAVVGGHDEMTPAYFGQYDRVGFWKKEFCSPESLLKSETSGSLAGEGSISFLLTDKKVETSYAKIEGFTSFYTGGGNIDINRVITDFIASSGWSMSDVDLLMTGINGDVDDNRYYQQVTGLFPGASTAWYKHLSLEYFTSPAFGLLAAANCLKEKKTPNSLLISNKRGGIRNIVLYNHFKGKTHSLILLSPCSD